MTSVKLISYSKSPDGLLSDCQELVAYCARVSNPSNQMNKDTNGFKALMIVVIYTINILFKAYKKSYNNTKKKY